MRILTSNNKSVRTLKFNAIKHFSCITLRFYYFINIKIKRVKILAKIKHNAKYKKSNGMDRESIMRTTRSFMRSTESSLVANGIV